VEPKKFGDQDLIHIDASLMRLPFTFTEQLAMTRKREALYLSVGLEACAPGEMTVMIPRDTPFPIERTVTLFTRKDYQTAMKFAIYQGERPLVKDNIRIGEFTFHGLEAALRHQKKLLITFKVKTRLIHLNVKVSLALANNKSIKPSFLFRVAKQNWLQRVDGSCSLLPPPFSLDNRWWEMGLIDGAKGERVASSTSPLHLISLRLAFRKR
jgi:hypothetical protein